MNLEDFNITDNGDGTFTLTPKNPNVGTKALVDEYRAIKAKGLALLEHRNTINEKLQALVARRDEIRTILVAAGVDGETWVQPQD